MFEENIAPLAGPRDQQPAHPLIPELSDRPRINNSLPNSVSPEQSLQYYTLYRDEDPTFFSTDPDPAQLEKYSGSDLKSK